MQVVEIIVSAGRTFNHPHEDYSNLRPNVTLKAILDESDDYQSAVKELQAKAEGMVEDHKQNLLSQLNTLYEMDEQRQRVQSLSAALQRTQRELDEIREKYPQLATATGSLGDPDFCRGTYCGHSIDYHQGQSGGCEIPGCECDWFVGKEQIDF